MKQLFFLLALAVDPVSGIAQSVEAAAPEKTIDTSAFAPVPADSVDLNEFLWKNRVVVVFALTEADPAYVEQLRLLEARWDQMAERDVVLVVDTDPSAMTGIRQKLRPRGFMMVIIGKDGGVKLRKPFPWDVREISRSIDKMPLRQEELRLERLNPG
mgnify:CR=1 FL=1